MKRILITGANSYIGLSLENYLAQWPNEYEVSTVDMIDGLWREMSFSNYDTVYHVAGIAHIDVSKITNEQKSLYYRINTDLAIETACKAKADGVQQFIFMSSAAVYGDSAPIGKHRVITRDTPVSPTSHYGISKVQAERGILALQNNRFKAVILRPPMVYGKGSKGNYPVLRNIAMKLPLFPLVNNARSMLYIGNLVEFVRLMIENNEEGIFWPQNAEYSNTSEMFKMIAGVNGRKVLLIRGFNWLLYLTSRNIKVIKKAFGSFTYEQSMSEYKEEYRIYQLKDSIVLTESNE